MNMQTRLSPHLGMYGATRIRPPREEDAAYIHALIEKCPQLDTNSCYTYLLQAWHFADTCAVAEVTGSIAGYVSAYIPPKQPDTLFIWQILVTAPYRGTGLALSMVQQLLRRPSAAGINYIDSTITRNNAESEQFFLKLANQLGAEVSISERLPAAVFRPSTHGSERLFHIGPIKHRAGLHQSGDTP